MSEDTMRESAGAEPAQAEALQPGADGSAESHCRHEPDISWTLREKQVQVDLPTSVEPTAFLLDQETPVKPGDLSGIVSDSAMPFRHLAENVEELAEDMVDVRTRLDRIEQKHSETVALLQSLHASIQGSVQAQVRELDALRRDLLSERNAFASKSAFNAIVPSLDSLRAMADGLSPDQDERMPAQLKGVVSSLSEIVRMLGYSEFSVAVGEPFDPGAMQCVGYQQGRDDVVEHLIRPGYRVGDAVVRPADVVIGKDSWPPQP